MAQIRARSAERLQATPIVEVRKDDRDRAFGHRRRHVLEIDDAHVGGQGHRNLPSDLGHFGDPDRRVLQVLEHSGQCMAHFYRRGRRPGPVRVQPQGQVRELQAQGPDNLHVVIGREEAALQFDGGEAVFVDHPPRLGHDAGRVEGLAPFIWLGAGVAGPFVKEVGAIGHPVAHGPAQQVAHGPAQGPAGDVEARHFKRCVDPVDRPSGGDDAGQAVCVPSYGAGQGLPDPGADLVLGEHIGADDGPGGGVQPLQVVGVAVRLAQPGQPRPRVHLDDGPQGVGLVNADLVQQRRVGESDGRNRNACNLKAFITKLGKVHPGIVGPGRRVTVPARVHWRTRPVCAGHAGPSTSTDRTLSWPVTSTKPSTSRKRAPGNWTGKTWARIVIGRHHLVYVILFIVLNSTSVKIDFVFFSVRSQLWVGFLVCLVLGGVLGGGIFRLPEEER